ncbi:MAG: MauE/DoxX family redox-associated membrane protein [Sphingobacteriales bacterium]
MVKEKHTEKYVLATARFLLILLWVYAALSKLLSFSVFRTQMNMQPFYPFMRALLVYALPPVELAVAVFLVFESTVKKGLVGSLFLLALFTGYVGLAAAGFFVHRPCSCGGVLTHIGWKAHFWFNLAFFAINVSALWITRRKEVVTK